MPFPFLPAGAVLALAVLGGMFAGFGLALRLVDRAALTARTSIAPGIVSGMRNWTHQQPQRPASSSAAQEPALGSFPVTAAPEAAPTSLPPDAVSTVDELDAAPDVPMHRVRRH